MATPGSPRPTTPVGLFVEATTRDGARPRLTWYDDATGERVELSGATLSTWVAKCAHLLTSDLGAGPGCLVLVDLPRHWTAAVWWLAVDAVGARLAQPGQEATVAVVGPERLEHLPPAEEVVAVSMRPMGAPFTDPLPPLVHDFFDTARGQPDHYPFGAGPEADDDNRTAAAERGLELASGWSLSSADRLLAQGPWVADAPQGPPGPELWAPMAADASVVWVRNPSPAAFVQRLASEQVSAVLAPSPGRSPAPGIRVLTPGSVSFSRPDRPS
jgi:uncharacterized protein (TIGR03089 family)